MDSYTAQAPTFTQGANPWKPLNTYSAKLPGMFDTSGLTQDYNRQISDQYDIGRSASAAAMAGYANRAQQSGASSLGAGFAGGQAMLGSFREANRLRSDLSGRILQSNTAQAGIGADLAARIGQLQSARQSQLAEYQMSQQRLGQSSQQFNADLEFRRQQLAQQQLQFNSNFNQHGLEYQNSLGGGGGGGGGGYQTGGNFGGLSNTNGYYNGPKGNTLSYDLAGAAPLPNGVSDPGYISSFGPIRAAQQYGQNLSSYGQLGASGPNSPAAIVAWGPGGKIGGGREPIPAWMRQNGY